MVDSRNKEILSAFGTAIKSLRVGQGLSQEELAERSRLHRTYITDVERGVRNVTLDSITKLARGLNVPLTEIFETVEGRVSAKRGESDVQVVGKPFEILLVENNRDQVDRILRSLEKNAVTNPLVVVRTGEDALDFLFGQGQFASRIFSPPPRIIMLDLSLPTMSGLEVLRRIRDHERTRSISVVILTSSRSASDYKESMKLGVAASMKKPVDFMEFTNVMPKLGFRWQLVVRE